MTVFHRRFFQKTTSKITPAYLLTIKQGRNEPIQEFMTRFNKECLKVEDINDLLLISAFQNGILPGNLYKELVRYKPRTSIELWDIVDRFAEAEEADRRKREADRGEPSRREEDRRDRGPPRRSALDRIQRGPLESRLGPRNNDGEQRRNDFPTPSSMLTKSKKEIYELHTDLFVKPKPMKKGPGNKSRRKYCTFHKDYGHDTEECRNLDTAIETLVHQGTLRQYQGNRSSTPLRNKSKRRRGPPGERCIDPADKKMRRDTDEDDDEPQYDGIVATITGLPHSSSRASLKTEARTPVDQEPVHKRFKAEETITFSEQDPVPSKTPHQDALVIQAVVANKLVYRVYIDSGASVSILFKECFDKLGVEEHLKAAPVPLRSFVQEETKSEGVIALPVTVGNAPTSTTKMIQFFVVNAYSPYNIILGRDWLNAVRAICSTYHLTIKFPTKNGTAVVRGDQKRAKECMQIALRKNVGASSSSNKLA